MTREALAAALESDWSDTGYSTPFTRWLVPILEAARERLAQLPEKCGTCRGKGRIFISENPRRHDDPCPVCHGSGKVYPAELVERIALVLFPISGLKEPDGHIKAFREYAVAVLDAINETTL